MEGLSAYRVIRIPLGVGLERVGGVGGGSVMYLKYLLIQCTVIEVHTAPVLVFSQVMLNASPTDMS